MHDGHVATMPPFYGTCTQHSDVMTVMPHKICLKNNHSSRPKIESGAVPIGNRTPNKIHHIIFHIHNEHFANFLFDLMFEDGRKAEGSL